MFDRDVCLFCQRTGVKLTKEHVWPLWVSDVAKRGVIVVDPNDQKIWSTEYHPGVVHRTEQIQKTVKRVCTDCNSGWMNALEAEARPLLKPMIAGLLPVQLLNAGDLLTLSRWAFKCALVAEYMFPDPKLPDEWYTDFYKTGEPPPEARIWAAAYRGNLQARYWGQRVPIVHRAGPRDPETVVGEGWLCTFSAYKAIFQVLFHPMGTDFPPTHAHVDYFAAVIWPNPRLGMSWPPNGRALNADEMERWAYRPLTTTPDICGRYL